MVVVKSWPRAVTCSFQDFEREKSVKENIIFLVLMINSKHVHFYWGVLYSLPPPMHIFGGSRPSGIDAPGRGALICQKYNSQISKNFEKGPKPSNKV